MYLRTFVPFLSVAGLCLLLAGCSGRVGPTVKGQVMLDGQPLGQARVVFEGKSGGALATTDAEGKFFLDGTLHKTLQPGSYTVRVTKFVDKKSGEVPSENDYEQLLITGQVKNLVPAQYDKSEGNPLTAEIKEGANDLKPFEIKTK